MTSILDEGLDELAVASHAGFLPRIAVNVATAWVFSMIIPGRVCAIWVAVTLALEAQAWFATLRQARGEEVGWGRRLWHVAGLAVSSLAWVMLGALGWAYGGVEGELCATVLWLSVIFFSQTNAYQSPIGFVVGGVIPAVAVMAVVAFAPHAPGLRLAPFVTLLALALVFAGQGAARMLRARQELATTQAEQRRSEALYRMLADNVTDVISLNDVFGKRLYMSPSIEAALGYPIDDLYKMPMYTYIYPDDRAALVQKTADLARTGGRATVQYRVIRGDGEVVWVETNFTMVETARRAAADGQRGAQHPGPQGDGGGADRGARGRRGGRRRQVRLPRQHDPRAQDPAQRHHRLRRRAERLAAPHRRRCAPRPADLRRQRHPARPRQQRARLLPARGRRGGAGSGAVRSGRRGRARWSSCSPTRPPPRA